jgi:phosphatidylserine decarboxylase
MAILEEKTMSSLVPVEPASIQPGGGFCMSLELAWGRLRRGWLRRFHPGYVRTMAERREGDCPNCPHDIVDHRDLKFYRNSCGYRFRDGGDPCGRLGGIPLARAGLAEVVVFSLAFLAAGILLALTALWVHWIFWVPAAVTLALWIFVISFFRDPERALPTDPESLLSPADGTVTHVEEVEDADFPDGRAFRISIFLSVFNVHVNRIPRSGTIVAIRYFPGCFLDARHEECAVRNEQLWLDLKETGTGRLLRVKQISGAIARRIVCWVRPGELVHAGDRFGMIKFGSRTDVLLATNEKIDVKVKVGDKVRGGSTVLLRFAALPEGQ